MESKKNVSVFLALSALAFALASCGKEDDEFEAKRLCYEKRVAPLRDRAAAGDPTARARLQPEFLNRYAEDCGMTAEEKKKVLGSEATIATPRPSSTSTSQPSPNPTTTALPTQVQDVPVQEMTAILKSVPNDGKCRLRYFDSSAGANAGYNVLAGNTVIQATGLTYFNQGISAYTNAVYDRTCSAGAAENCTLRFRSAKSKSFRGYYVAIEGNDLVSTGYSLASDAVRDFNRLKAAGICELKVKANCSVVDLRPGQTGFAVVSDTNGWMHDYPMSRQDEADFQLTKLRDMGFCN
ncbi:MAG: hypothetical protein JNL01_16680 [Bdellovibrionales bacterium]|nr:hypothetical protein [Bdellovibrionales bacterium]